MVLDGSTAEMVEIMLALRKVEQTVADVILRSDRLDAIKGLGGMKPTDNREIEI